MSPDRKRLRSRSSRVAIDFGGRSEVSTTWLRGAVEGVEGVEELLLERLLALHELDVVDEQDVALAVAALEGGRGVVPDGVDELVHERLGGDVADVAPGEVLADVVPDGMQQVGLAQPGAAVDEQRVVRTRRHLGDGQGGGVGEAVGRPDDEGVEGVAGIEPPTSPACLGDRRPASDQGRSACEVEIGAGATSSSRARGESQTGRRRTRPCGCAPHRPTARRRRPR